MRSQFVTDTRGGVLLLFALGLPAVVGGAAVAVEYATLTQRRAQLQTAADTAALTAAKELRLANTTASRVQSVAKSTAEASAQMGRREGASTGIEASMLDGRSGVQVSINETVPSLIGQLLSAPSMQVGVVAVARVAGSSRLCMVVHGLFELESG